jgi:L-2-hydroxyglutarate oxidase
LNGRNQLIKFAKENNISHDICGKIILAVSSKEVNELADLKKNGEKNGLDNLEIIDMKKVKEIEPYAEGHSALFVPQSGIIDYKGVTKKLAELIKEINQKSKIETNCKVLNIGHENLFSTKGIINASHSIFCGGLFSDRLAKKDCLKLKMRIVGFRGDYYELKEKSKHKVKNLIYPVPNPEFPFLGVHFTRMTDGSIECGPNAVFTFKREGYKKTAFGPHSILPSVIRVKWTPKKGNSGLGTG